MITKAKYPIILFISLILFSCSWLTDFVVMNGSDAPIELNYRFKLIKDKNGLPTCPGLKFFGGPEIPKNGEYKGSKTYWVALSSERYQYSESECAVTLTLEPDQIIKIGSIPTYTGHKSGRGDFLGVEQLTLKTKDGLITYSGLELVRRFKKKADILYILEYK